MATHTTYYNLTKPAQNDKVNIGVLNDNADIIDTTLHNKVNVDELTADNVMLSDGVTSVESALDKLQFRIAGYDYYNQHSQQFFSVPANSTGATNITVPDVAGYNRWCILHMYSSSNGNIAPLINGYKTGDNIVNVVFKNFTSSAVNVNPNVIVMYYNE